MAGMTNARKEVAEALRDAGLTVKDHYPEKVVPPLVVMNPTAPVLEEAGTYDATAFVFHLNLRLVIGTKPNSDGITALEEMVEKVIFNLGGWKVEGLDEYFLLDANNALYPAVDLHISNQITIEGGN